MMKTQINPRVRLAALLLLVMTTVVACKGADPADQVKTAPVSVDNQVADIQNNPAMSPEQKAAAIANVEGHRKSHVPPPPPTGKP